MITPGRRREIFLPPALPPLRPAAFFCARLDVTQTNPTLAAIKIRNNFPFKVTAKAVAATANPQYHNSALKPLAQLANLGCLHLRGTKASAESMESLRKALPKCYIVT